MTCPYCGRSQKDEQARFCSGCGKRLPPPHARTEERQEGEKTQIYRRGSLMDVPPERAAAPAAAETSAPKPTVNDQAGEKQQTLFMQSQPATEAEQGDPDESQERASRPFDGTGHFYVDAHAISPAQPTTGQKNATPTKRRKGRRKAGFVAVATLLFLVLLGGFTSLFLGLRNSPKTTVDGFFAAIQARDWALLGNYADFPGMEITENGKKIFFNSFENNQELTENLLENGVITNYSSITLQEEPLLFWISRYRVRVEATALFIRNLPENARVVLDGEEAAGEATEDGVLFRGLIPGEYFCEIYVPAAETGGEEQLFYSASFTAADPVNPAYLELEPPEPEPEPVVVTVENCLSDTGEIYINSVFSDVRPVNGVLTLTDPVPGSVIKIIIYHEDYTQEATVTYTGEATALRFDNYVGEPPAPPTPSPTPDPNLPDPQADPVGFADALGAQAAQDLLAAFYSSYLDCVNAQDIGLMQHSTQFMNENLLPRLSLSGNLTNNFVFQQAVCAEESYHATEEEGRPAILINASFTYEYRRKTSDGAYSAGGNKSSLQLLYVDGEWKVNRMVGVSDEQYANNQFGDFSTAATP